MGTSERSRWRGAASRRAGLRLLALLTAAAIPACRAVPSAGGGSEGQAVLRLLRAQEEAWNRGDLEGFLEGYLDSPEITFFTGGRVLRGREALRKRYQERYLSEGKEMGRLAFDELRVDLLGPGAAIARGRWRVKTSKEELGGLFTLLLEKSLSGWHIVHDHTSS
jgi:uncharacterized protein (TIGR02246 family)